MGVLDQVIGGALGSSGGSRSSPLMTGLMALLGSRAGGAGGLGGLLGSSSGSIAGGGLGSLLDRFTQSGHGDIANSWIGAGENRLIAPNQLEEALGPETVDDLARRTGLPQQDLLAQLSHYLPGVVDKLTPQGRMPDASELSRW